MTVPTYGIQDASYQAAGGLQGITQLVEQFYQAMDQEDFAKPLRQLYPEDLSEAKERLTAFLSGWLGGPKLYQERFGSLNIPSFHTRWQVDQAQTERWLQCMTLAAKAQGYPQDFAEYLLKQLSVPAERIRQACSHLAQ